MSEIFDEVNEDLKQQQLHDFWQENKYWVIGGVIAAVIVTGAMSFWQQWEYKRDTKATYELSKLVENISNTASLEDFAKTSDKKHSVVAKFILADNYLQKNKKDEALKLYSEIAETSGIDKTYRDLAKVLNISQRIDSGDTKSLQAEISELTSDDSAWRYTARELQAMIYSKEGNMDQAINSLTRITNDPEAPNDVRTRASTLKELYIAEKNKS